MPTCALIPMLAVVAVVSAQDKKPQEPVVQSHENRLAKETSPYLRQHSHNPVDWYPWGREALDRAKKEDRAIFLSIGYSACHWCHVMEAESFENPAIAAVMNENFVCIKVDREERPDLDELYMTAVQAMTGQGGWPMSVWLTPDGKPFYGGTYFPPDDRFGRPGFRRVLEHLAKVWKERRADAIAGGDKLVAHLQQVMAPAAVAGDVDASAVQSLVETSGERFDSVYGGFGSGPEFAPKFPHASELQVLLRVAAAGDKTALRMATLTLDGMCKAGMYDQLGGGFHRYSTDQKWLVPHFEKMLYDNALLVPCYLEARLLTGDTRYAVVARQTLDYMLRELRSPKGGFYSSQDADSDGEEGRFFVWSKAEFDQVAGADAAVAAAHFGVTEAGNWEHKNVLTAERVPSTADAAAIGRARAALFAARERRTRPHTDDKVLTAWNALAIIACARGHQVLGDAKYLTAAQQAADFVCRELVRDGRCLRSWHSGTAQHAGYLEDHAGLALALLVLFESDGEPRWLRTAKTLLTTVQLHFRAADGSLFTTADDHEALLARASTPSESSTPSGASLAVQAFLRAGLLLGDEALYQFGVDALRANQVWLHKLPVSCPSLVLALQFHLADPREIVVAGDGAAADALLATAWRAFPTATVIAPVRTAPNQLLNELSKVFVGKDPRNGAPAAYVCRRGVCGAPVTTPDALQKALAGK